MSEGLSLVIRAARFASSRHAGQERKGIDGGPYFDHPLEVASLLASVGRVDDPVILAAALLHDTLEDTETSPEELEEQFGQLVRRLVEEVSDDKSLPRGERKELQVERSRQYSPGARLIRIADKISNLRGVRDRPPPEWSADRRREYLEWAARVIRNCRGTSPPLEKLFDETAASLEESAQERHAREG